MPNPSPSPARWPALLVVGLPLAALLATLWPMLHLAWTDRPAYSHGYLILGVCLWLGYREFRRAPIGRLAPSVLGLAALAVVLAAAVVGRAADVALVAELAIPAVAVAALWAAAGWSQAKRFLVPAAYIGFAIPFWDSINELLRRMTVLVVGMLTRQASIPALIDGNMIRIPSGTFEVAGGCSGLHFMIVGTALGTLYAILSFRTWSLRVAVVALSVVLALVANWLRVFIVIVAGYLTDMQHYLVTVDHYYFGWALFFVVFSLLFVFAYYFGEVRGDDASVASAGTPAEGHALRALADYRVLGSSLLLAVAAWLSFQAAARPDVAPGSVTQPLPASLGDWKIDGEWPDITRPHFVNWSREGQARYVLDNMNVGVYLAHYAVQRQGQEVVYYANSPSGERGRVIGRSDAVVALAHGSVSFTELEIEEGDLGRRLVRYAYQIAGRRTGDALAAKLFQVIGGARGRWDAQVIVMSSSCEPACDGARAALDAFARDATELLLGLIQSETVDKPGPK